ncbi:MAG: hypothetical protein CMM50_14315 [Rhodospirillaceae bacterium]|nr:hypothetical protein [Rhodospirillaceae bacterium]
MAAVIGVASFALALLLFAWGRSTMSRQHPPEWARNWLYGDLLAIAVSAFLAFGVGGVGKGFSDLMNGRLGTIGLIAFAAAVVLAVGTVWTMSRGAGRAQAEPPLAPVTPFNPKRQASRHQAPKRRAA